MSTSYSEASAYIDRLSESLGAGVGTGSGSGSGDDDYLNHSNGHIGNGSANINSFLNHSSSRVSPAGTSKLTAAALGMSENRYSSPPRSTGTGLGGVGSVGPGVTASMLRSRSPTYSSTLGQSHNQSGRTDYVRSSTSVLAAFRELQSKAKRLELSRSDTIRQCEDLKDSIAKIKRTKEAWQRQNEADTMESLLSLRAQCEQLRRNRDEYHSKVKMLEEQQHQYQKTIATQRARCAGLEDDINALNSKIRTEKFKKDSTSRELADIEHRCEDLDEEVVKSPIKHKKQSGNKREILTNMDNQLESVRRATFKAEIKIEALRKYVDLLMNINGDLCTTLTAREMTKEKILELAKKYAPPRYTWPKHFEYTDMVQLLTDAAMTAAKDGALARATAATIAAVGMSPFHDRKSAPLRSSVTSSLANSVAGGLTSLSSSKDKYQRPRSAPPASRRVTAYTRDDVSSSSSRLDPTALASKLLSSASVSSGASKSKKKTSKKSAPSQARFTRADGLDAQLARTAARIASLSMPTINPDVENIPSFRLALSSRRSSADDRNVSPTATRDIGPPIHADNAGVFVPAGQTPTGQSPGSHNEFAKRSQTQRSMNQSVAQFHSA
jgi:predicted  nucleic acid-binding Zn-ribbon protein